MEEKIDKPPYFSVIVPSYNREQYIEGTLISILVQSFTDYEIVVVDDCSSDNTVQIIRKMQKQYSQIRLLVNPENRGVSPTRNIGRKVAKGQWSVFVDSDDELLEGALQVIYDKSQLVTAQVGELKFSCVTEPQVEVRRALPNQQLNYVEFLKDMNANLDCSPDVLHVYRTSTFQCFNLNRRLRMYETEEALDFVKQFDVQCFSDVLLLIHLNAGNRLSQKFELTKNAKSLAISSREMIRKHGKALKKYAPAFYLQICNSLLFYRILSTSRRKGIIYVKGYLEEFGVQKSVIGAYMMRLVSRNFLIQTSKIRANIQRKREKTDKK